MRLRRYVARVNQDNAGTREKEVFLVSGQTKHCACVCPFLTRVNIIVHVFAPYVWTSLLCHATSRKLFKCHALQAIAMARGQDFTNAHSYNTEQHNTSQEKTETAERTRFSCTQHWATQHEPRENRDTQQRVHGLAAHNTEISCNSEEGHKQRLSQWLLLLGSR